MTAAAVALVVAICTAYGIALAVAAIVITRLIVAPAPAAAGTHRGGIKSLDPLFVDRAPFLFFCAATSNI